MYVLTIVFLASHVRIDSLYASLEACELVAARARAFEVGLQAIESARCSAAGATSAPAPADGRKKTAPAQAEAVSTKTSEISRGGDAP